MTSENVVINGAAVMHARKSYGDAFEKSLMAFRDRTHEGDLLTRYTCYLKEWLNAVEWLFIIGVAALVLTLFETTMVLVEETSAFNAVGWTSAFWIVAHLLEITGAHHRRLKDFLRRARSMELDLDALVVYHLDGWRKQDGAEAQSGESEGESAPGPDVARDGQALRGCGDAVQGDA